jgi:FkbM family methyltransferase
MSTDSGRKSAFNLRTKARRVIRKVSEDAAAKALRNPVIRACSFNALHLLSDSASVNIDGIHYTFSTDDWIIGRSLYVNGGWDDEFLECAVELVRERSKGKPLAEGTFVDIGANIGTTTIQALYRYHARRAICVEPSPRCLPYLYSNLAANRLASQCDVVEAALSDKPGEVAFKVGENNSGAGQVVTNDGTQDHIVKSQQLDQVIDSLNAGFNELALAWVDTEGHEYRVLSGAEKVIAAGTPFVIEFWPHQLRQNGDYELLLELLASQMGEIIDIRARVQGSRPSNVESSVAAIDAHADKLGPWPTDLLLLP